MKAALIVEAVRAMREAERLSFETPPRQFAEALVALCFARAALEAELGKLDIAVEDEKEKA